MADLANMWKDFYAANPAHNTMMDMMRKIANASDDAIRVHKALVAHADKLKGCTIKPLNDRAFNFLVALPYDCEISVSCPPDMNYTDDFWAELALFKNGKLIKSTDIGYDTTATFFSEETLVAEINRLADLAKDGKIVGEPLMDSNDDD